MSLDNFQALLFDLDGVILDSMDHHAAAWLRIMEDEGFRNVPKSFILENEGSLGPEVLARFVKEHGPKEMRNFDMDISKFAPNLLRMLNNQAELYLAEYAQKVRLYPGAEALLSALADAGVPFALVTSSRKKMVQTCLPPEVLSLFGAVVSADDVERHKPYPDPYLAGAKAIGVETKRCLVVENAPAGITAALRAGAACYAIASTLDESYLSQAHAVFSDIKALSVHLGLCTV